jgi:hypothetical protein
MGQALAFTHVTNKHAALAPAEPGLGISSKPNTPSATDTNELIFFWVVGFCDFIYSNTILGSHRTNTKEVFIPHLIAQSSTLFYSIKGL